MPTNAISLNKGQASIGTDSDPAQIKTLYSSDDGSISVIQNEAEGPAYLIRSSGTGGDTVTEIVEIKNLDDLSDNTFNANRHTKTKAGEYSQLSNQTIQIDGLDIDKIRAEILQQGFRGDTSAAVAAPESSPTKTPMSDVDTKPIQTKPVETKPTQTKPVETNSPNEVTNSSTAAKQTTELDLKAIASQTGADFIAVMDMDANVIGSFQGKERIEYPASTIKLVLADAIRKKISNGELKLSDTLGPVSNVTLASTDPSSLLDKEMTVEQALTTMLRDSNNTATNLLLEHLGGPGSKVNSTLDSLGYSEVEFNRYLGKGQDSVKNLGTAEQLAKAMQSLYTGNDAVSKLAQKALADSTLEFGSKGSLGNKIGTLDQMESNVSVVEINGKRYVIASYFKAPVDGNVNTQGANIRKTEDLIYDQLSRVASEKRKPATTSSNFLNSLD